MPHFNPEQIIDELYGPPPKQGQKKLEDFIKKNVPKPERPKSLNQEITARDKEGKEVVFDLEKIKQEWISFYKDNNLNEFAEAIENIDIQLADEQTQKLQEKSEQGFDRLILLPSTELQQKRLQQTKQETEKEMPGLKDDQQYSTEKTWLSGAVEPNFPDKIEIKNREKTKTKPYFLFLKDTPEVDGETLNKTPEQLRTLFSRRKETGLTISEYLIFQRDYTERHKTEETPHPDTIKYTYLLDSELSPDSSGPGRVLGACWSPDSRRVLVRSLPSGLSISFDGARPSAIFEI